MKRILLLSGLLLFFVSCKQEIQTNITKVNNAEELNLAIKNAKAGDQIVLANGIWNDIQIQFSGIGTKEAPIVLKAETAGEVTIEGASNLQIGGAYLEVRDLHFKNGFTPTRNVIQFKIDDDTFANHCKVTNCVIEEFTQPNRDDTITS